MQIFVARFGRHRKTMRYGNSKPDHFRQVGALAAEKPLNLVPITPHVRLDVIEFLKEINILFCHDHFLLFSIC